MITEDDYGLEVDDFWPDESRIDTIGVNGNDGLHYEETEDANSLQAKCVESDNRHD